MTYCFELPIYIYAGNKKLSLNFNWYRNAHFFVKNTVKQLYAPFPYSSFEAKKISIAYRMIWNNKRRTDFMNWITVADKFFLDYLTENGYIPDDCAKNYASMSASIEIDTTAKESYIIAEVTVLE